MISLNKVIEHTLLRPDCTIDSIRQLCQEATENEFFGVCVPPYYVRDAVRFLKEQAKVVTVIGFPLGYSTIPAKVEEIKRALDEGAHEVDMVVNICAVKSKNWSHVRNELDSTMRAVFMRGRIMKLIVETGLLTREEISLLLPIVDQQEVQFVKTSTGFNGGGATVDDVAFLRKNLPSHIKIKASGGIKTAEQATKLLAAGAARIGSSSSLQIVKP